MVLTALPCSRPKATLMRQSSAGPIPDDIALCERLFEVIKTSEDTLFDDMYIQDIDGIFQNRSKARRLMALQPLFIPSAENQYIRGETRLKDVIDGYDDLWAKAEPILHDQRPQPSHARGLKRSAFSANQLRKLGIKLDESSLYTVREEMLFPYLTAESKRKKQALELADRENMHNMSFALRAFPKSPSATHGAPKDPWVFNIIRPPRISNIWLLSRG